MTFLPKVPDGQVVGEGEEEEEALKARWLNVPYLSASLCFQQIHPGIGDRSHSLGVCQISSSKN